MMAPSLSGASGRASVFLAFVCMWLLSMSTAWPLDPPHDSTRSIECLSCHIPHGAPGGALNAVDGNPNLCMSCHNPAGSAAAKSFADSHQAIPGVIGSSHRWDSSPAGHVTADSANASTGAIVSGGVHDGRYARVYTLTIDTGGDAGVATFQWTDDAGNASPGSLATGSDIALAEGVILDFRNGSGSPASFLSGDIWTLRVQPDLRMPVFSAANNPEHEMAARLSDPVHLGGRNWDFTYSKVVCSVCHDQHSQEMQPFDPSAPPWFGDGSGEGRHFQREPNDQNQMCLVCHDARNVQDSDDGSHPVLVPIPGGDFQSPASLPLTADSKVVCLSCHAPHFADSGGANGGAGDGFLLRDSINDICLQCHTLADQSGGSHFDPANGLLWPGGQYGSSFPAHSADKRGACVNCHWPHGWPDNDNEVVDFSRLWVERYDVADDGSDPDDAEDLCYTCHDGGGSGTDILGDFDKGSNGANIFHHPVMDSEQSPGRSVECVDCHNPHKARPDNRYAGVAGVDVATSPADTTEQLVAEVTEATQYSLCFKCHGASYNAARTRTSNKRLDFNTGAANSGYHPVTQAGRNQSANLQTQLADSGSGLTTSSTIRCTDCHNSDATGSTAGPVVDSTGLTQGPHGSTSAPILRANFNTNYTSSSGSWSDNNAALCFLCHDRDRLLSRRFSEGARTNFYQNNGRDNLHWYHLVDKDVTPSCLSCHYDIHSNRTASNTQYRWRVNGQWFTSTSPPANVKTHLVNFAPDVQANSYSMPRWQINTETGQRQCDVSCHGKDMDNEPYQPPSGDDPSHTY